MKDLFCECGQYLTTYFRMLGKCHPGETIEMRGVPCPAKDCKKTYTVQKTAYEETGEPILEGIRLPERSAAVVMDGLSRVHDVGGKFDDDDIELLSWIAQHYPLLKEQYDYLPWP